MQELQGLTKEGMPEDGDARRKMYDLIFSAQVEPGGTDGSGNANCNANEHLFSGNGAAAPVGADGLTFGPGKGIGTAKRAGPF